VVLGREEADAMRPKANGTANYRGLLIEHCEEDGQAAVTVRRVLDQDKGASLDFVLETGCFSDEAETELSVKECEAVAEIAAAYAQEGLW